MTGNRAPVLDGKTRCDRGDAPPARDPENIAPGQAGRMPLSEWVDVGTPGATIPLLVSLVVTGPGLGGNGAGMCPEPGNGS